MNLGLRLPALRYLLLGSVLGIALLHPVMEVIYWFGSHERYLTGSASFWHSLTGRFLLAFTPSMLPMTGLFAFIGAAVGWSFWLYVFRVERPGGAATLRGDNPARDLAAVLAGGEGEQVEFKACLRWDTQLGRVNRALEDAVARTIAGFLNHRGGIILIGVTDSGQIAGLQADYQTLKRRNRDGFQQFLMTLVQSKMGGHICARVHVDFCAVLGIEVCQVKVQPSAEPVYYQDGSVARYFIRTGNGTRELDVREAIVHLAQRRTEGRTYPAEPRLTAAGAP